MINLSKLLLVIFIASCIILPSGTIYFINVKTIISLMLLGMVFLVFTTGAAKRSYYVSILATVIFVGFYFMVGMLNEVPTQNSLSQAFAIFSCFSAIYLPFFQVSKKTISTDCLVLVIIKVFGILCTLKLLVEIHMLSGAGLEQTKLLINDIFGVSFIGLDAGWFYRIHLPSDYLAPAVLFSLLRRNELGVRISQSQTNVLIVLTLATVVLSYSRYLWMFTLIAVVLAIIATPNLKLKIAVFSISTILIAWLSLASHNPVYRFIEDRYAGDYAESSDSTRIEMFSALTASIPQKPIFGWGLGASTHGYTNIEAVPWYYEMQWLGFVMQFGVIGLLVLLFLSMIVTFLIMKKPLTTTKIGLVSLYFLWLTLGLFNGFMLTSVGGIIFLMFTLLALASNQNNKQYQLVNPHEK